MIVTYDPAEHYAMIASWRPDPPAREQCGTGLVVPDICAGFVGAIGGTRAAFFYGFVSNPLAPAVIRGRQLRLLASKLHSVATRAGLEYAYLVTDVEGIEHLAMLSMRGVTSDKHKVFEGRL